MAQRLGIGRRSIVRYEDDQAAPSQAVLIAWSSVTDVPLEWLEGSTVTGTALEGYLPDYQVTPLLAA